MSAGMGTGGDWYELEMPFVSVASNGGPYDDDAYAAGWAMGALDARLGTHPHVRPLRHEETVRTVDVPQADLIAMRHGYRMAAEQSQDAPEWAFCEFVGVVIGGGS
jgi:hypothetical protein